VSTVAPRPQVQLQPSKLFVPVLDTDVVVRDRLRRHLSDGSATRLILVSAPAGSGKTTLVADWVRSLQSPVAWISLDPDDDDPQRLMEYLAEAVQSIAPAAGQRAAVLLSSTPPPDPRDVATAIAAELSRHTGPQRGTNGVIVFDDYHFVSDRQLHDAVTFLLDRAPGITLVLITRSDPPLPLARLRARRQLCEIREADLRFQPDEASAFLERICARALSAAVVKPGYELNVEVVQVAVKRNG